MFIIIATNISNALGCDNYHPPIITLMTYENCTYCSTVDWFSYPSNIYKLNQIQWWLFCKNYLLNVASPFFWKAQIMRFDVYLTYCLKSNLILNRMFVSWFQCCLQGNLKSIIGNPKIRHLGPKRASFQSMYYCTI